VNRARVEYSRVVAVWLAVLIALYFLQEYFG
jgi:hypothetical protein